MFAEWAAGYVGIPYKLSGRTKTSCDCYGLVRIIYDEVMNIKLPSFSDDYTDESDSDTLTTLYNDNKINWVCVDKPQVGDLIYLMLSGYPKHVGVIVGDNHFIHNLTDNGSSTIADYTNNKWKQRVIGFYRWKKK